jgi:hypothetical protein
MVVIVVIAKIGEKFITILWAIKHLPENIYPEKLTPIYLVGNLLMTVHLLTSVQNYVALRKSIVTVKYANSAGGIVWVIETIEFLDIKNSCFTDYSD